MIIGIRDEGFYKYFEVTENIGDLPLHENVLLRDAELFLNSVCELFETSCIAWFIDL